MLELEHGFRVVDVHARLDPEGTSDAAGPTVGPEDLEREMHQAGIVRAMVSPGPREGDYLRANNEVARHTVDRPFVAFARIGGPREPGDSTASRLRSLAGSRDGDHATPADVERYAYDDRFHGFKLDPARDGLPGDGVLDVLEEAGLPVLVEVGEAFPPAVLEETLLERSFPVIAAHFGGYPLNRDLMAEAVDLLSRHDDCYLDTSAVRFRDVLERAMLAHPDRVLFGSGAPDVHPNVGVMELLTLDIPQDGMRRTFWKNADRVFDDALEVARWE